MIDAKDRVVVNICVQSNGVRLYGNREFFAFLKSELDHLINCPRNGYCEFQTVSLTAQPHGLSKRPHIKAYHLPDDAADLSLAVELNPEEFDVVFMTVEEGDLR